MGAAWTVHVGGLQSGPALIRAPQKKKDKEKSLKEKEEGGWRAEISDSENALQNLTFRV